jgi:23S rRNA (adenine2503-C2)-methyltransferase
MIPFHSLTQEECADILIKEGEKPFRAKQIFQWVYGRREIDWEKMTDLGGTLREKLRGLFSLSSIKERRILQSKDEETIKFLWELADGKLVESVLILSNDRRTVCVSSQVGCPARCAFCASGKEGLKRNLTAEEIFEQVYEIDRYLHKKGERVSHAVFMGMGEPFENYDNVLKAVRLLIDPLRLNLSQRRITISTVGVIEGIERLTQENIHVNLVLSLHAPNQHIRKKIIPYARKYELQDILDAMAAFAKQSKRDITYEYTLIAGINDQPEHAAELGRLLKGQQASVNLIPYNPVAGLRLERPEKEVIEEFRQVLSSYKIVTTWRYTKGKDIAAACGQLALQESQSSLSIAS